jgi:hypothetical protein
MMRTTAAHTTYNAVETLRTMVTARPRAVAFVWPAVVAGHGSSKHCLTGQGIQNFCAGAIIIKLRHLR